MTTITSDGDLEPTVAAVGPVANIDPAASRRIKGEALGLVVGVFAVLLAVALLLGGPLPIWQ